MMVGLFWFVVDGGGFFWVVVGGGGFISVTVRGRRYFLAGGG